MNKKAKIREFTSEICKRYLAGHPTTSLAKDYGGNTTMVSIILRENNIEIRKSQEYNRKYTLNHNYFEVIDSKDKAYFLGLLYADGSITLSKNSYKITLSGEDFHILETFNSQTNSNKPLHFLKSKNLNHQDTYSIELNSEKFISDLIDKKCIENKCFKIKFPNNEIVPDSLKWHFIRGFFDGDGSIGIYDKRLKLSITSNGNFLDGLKKYLEQNNIVCAIYPCRNSYSLTIDRIAGTKDFFDNMYKDSEIFKLNRKYKKYVEYNNANKS